MRARNCARNDSWGQWFYNNLNGDTGPVTLETWQQQYRALLATIASKLDARARAAAAAAPPASPAQVLLLAMTLPPLGEDLTDAVNAQVDAYNAALTQVVLDFAKEQKALLAKHSQPAAASGSAATAARPPAVVLDVKLVDISSECKAAIAKNQAARQAAGKWKPVVWPTPFFKAGCKIMGCQMTRDWWGLSYNAQSDAAGSAVITPDGIHINERGGDLVVGLLAAHLVKPLAAAPPPLQK
ncbi:hypothetical protein HYH02_000120 [Chlamydomonas schloesseri]|uniref:SGNH hydrolase-type esterase domain-containing protein n=1 Tax=Chlamydomonas schloesseri TaxID=2026947 RepID=A0A835WN77_9CHLO|nr:hypothetical protein HYH02_000120 [Chlamydomonas schloesseri]|eukprot:KAG2450016.1 hypothetical protein HYH02_000120 [Chlamydomonas schloesseri]